MKFITKTGTVLLSVIILFGSCDLMSGLESTSDYPVIFERVEMQTLREMNSAFQAANNGHICSTLNEYGRTGFSRVLFPDDENPCLSREVVRVEMTNEDTLLTAAKKALLKNQQYTGVSDTSKLMVDEQVALFGCTICEGQEINSVPIEWKVTFEEQKVDTISVRNTQISVFIDAEGVNRIWGNWYPGLDAEVFTNFGYLHAQEVFVGWEFDMRSYTGDEEIYTVKNQDLQSIPIMEYYPVEREGKLEIRKTWKVPIGCNENNFQGWFGYLDVVDGSVIALVSK